MEGMLTSIIVVAAGVFVIVRIFMRSRAAVIKSPRIGFLDFSGGELAGQLLEDKAAFGSLFESNADSISTPPQCDVLFLYCRIGPEGTIEGSHHGLRELIRDSGAVVVVIASENTGPQYGEENWVRQCQSGDDVQSQRSSLRAIFPRTLWPHEEG
jgi:hypothetical protein